MKNRKKLIKFGIFLFGISLLLWSCEKEDFNTKPEATKESKYSISEVGPSEIQLNTSLSEKLGELSKKENNLHNKSVYPSEHDFTVITNLGKYIESKDRKYHSYTFPITREIDNGLLENLLVTLRLDGNYNLFLISYNITEQEKSEFLQGKLIDLKDKVNYSKINSNLLDQSSSLVAISCVDIYTTYCGGEGNHPGGLLDGQACPAQSTSMRTYCDYSGGGPSTGGDDIQTNDDEQDHHQTGGGSLSNNNNDDDTNQELPIITVPVIPSRLDLEIISFFDNLIQQQKECLNPPFGQPQNNYKKDITNFFNNNQVLQRSGYDGALISAENRSFANAAIDALCSDNELDFKSLIIENQIKDDNLDPCSKEILTQLKSLQQSRVAKIISRFGAPNSTYDWEIKTIDPTIAANAAETDRRSGLTTFDYLTKIAPTYQTQATKNALVRTILHEMLHAYMISHIDDVNAGNTIDIREFLQLWQFIRNTNPPGGSSEPAQHEFMAQKYIPILKAALKEWDNKQQSDQYYEDLSWGALFNTGTFNHFHPVGSPSRTRITNTNLAEDTNTTQGGITPKGDSC